MIGLGKVAVAAVVAALVAAHVWAGAMLSSPTHAVEIVASYGD